MTILIIITIFLNINSLAQPYRVAIIPFTITAEKDLSSLKKGIYDILSSRLSKKDTVIIINRDETEKFLDSVKEFSGESQALMIGAKIQADFIIYGNLTVSDTIITLYCQIVDVSGKKPSLSYSKDIQKTEEVIPQINRFATEINEQFLIGEGEIKSEEDSVTLQPVDTLDTLTTTVDTTEQIVQTETDTLKETINPAFYKSDTSSSPDKEYWKSQIINILINGMAFGDVDNDGKNEIIILTPKMVQIYRFEGKEIKKVSDIYKIRFRYPIGIDMADINGNGFPEIFITALDSYQSRVNSLVLEFDGKNFNTLVKNFPWYLRVVRLKDNTPILLGQRHSRGGPFKGKIVEMKLDKSKYVPDREIIPPSRVNVLGSAYGDIMNNGQDVLVAYNRSNNINIINTSGEIIGESSETFGGSTLFYLLDNQTSEENREYLSMRIRINDINADGTVEIIAVKNYEIARNLFGKFRHYNKSHIEILTWDGVAMKTNWKTGIISGCIRDFAIDDFDNDGNNELVAALVHREGKFIFAKPKSSIIVYELK